MPRDLTSEVPTGGDNLVEPSTGPTSGSPLNDERADSANPDRHAAAKSNLHPYVRPLTLADIESCVILENAAFPPSERCSREKFLYRLTVCPELSLGLFSIGGPESPVAAAPTAATATPASSKSDEKEILLAHVFATKCGTPTVTDEAMMLPSSYGPGIPPTADGIGNQEEGRTIALHSLAVLPQFQRRRLGTIAVKSFIQRVGPIGIADRIALIAHDHYIPLYEDLGFTNLGQSKVQFGGGGWYDLVLEIHERHGGS